MDLSERTWTLYRYGSIWTTTPPGLGNYATAADERADVIEREPPPTRGTVDLTDDETRALVWAANRASRYLRAEGWPDMKNNAEIVDRAVGKLEATDHLRGAVCAFACDPQGGELVHCTVCDRPVCDYHGDYADDQAHAEGDWRCPDHPRGDV